MVFVFNDDRPILSLAEFAEVPELVLYLLTLIARRDACIDCGSHRKPPANMGLSAVAAKIAGGHVEAKVLNAPRVGSRLSRNRSEFSGHSAS